MKEVKTPQNPYAFACTNENEIQEGMTLRDYFAAQAIQSPVSYKPINFYHWLKWAFGYSFKGCSRPHEENAIQAYELADAMLKQREL